MADFGIARALGGPSESRLTQAGLALGTPAYMAPEQATGERGVDARTDQYSLAIVCFEMLIGRPPFEGTTGAASSPAGSRLPCAERAQRPEVPEAASRRCSARWPSTRRSGSARWPSSSGRSAPRRRRPPRHARDHRVSGRAARGDGSTSSRRAWLVPRVLVPAALALMAALVIGGIVLRSAPRPETADAAANTRLAVLPFDNVGDSADGYFADGMADAIRGKLTELDRCR